MTEKKHGGKRPNAGLKPVGKEKRKTGSINLEPRAWDNFKAYAEASGDSVSGVINQIGLSLQKPRAKRVRQSRSRE